MPQPSKTKQTQNTGQPLKEIQQEPLGAGPLAKMGQNEYVAPSNNITLQRNNVQVGLVKNDTKHEGNKVEVLEENCDPRGIQALPPDNPKENPPDQVEEIGLEAMVKEKILGRKEVSPHVESNSSLLDGQDNMES